MVKVFVLIAFMKYGYGGGAISQEFETLEKCEAAAAKIEEQFSGFTASSFTMCVPK